VTRAGVLFFTRAALLVAGWIIAGALVLIALLRIVAFDRTRLGTLVDAYTLWVYLPAYVVLVAALVGRRHALAAVAAVLVILHAQWVVPPLWHRRAVPAAARHAPHLRLVTANLRYTNPRPEALARELARDGADVLVMQELTEHWWATLRSTGLLDAYPNEVHVVHKDAGGAAVLSRLPMSGERIIDVDGWPFIAATVSVDGHPVRVFDVHPVPPAYLLARHRRMVRAITAELRDATRGDAPVVAAGDYNATQYNRWLHTLAGLGYRSAHEERGRPFATTWPNGEHHIPPIRVDHVLHTRGIVALSVHEGHGTGSDHRPVIADLAVLVTR
jgi:endonuclease/exonuclease/phosphatase (EEP) superfamily protein YafD